MRACLGQQPSHEMAAEELDGLLAAHPALAAPAGPMADESGPGWAEAGAAGVAVQELLVARNIAATYPPYYHAPAVCGALRLVRAPRARARC